MKPSNPTLYKLVVYRDYVESNGKWRLFWEDQIRPGLGIDDQSTVSGNPFFSTLEEAVNYGIQRYNERPERRLF